MHHRRSINRRCARNANICKKLLNRCPVAVFDGFAQGISINQSHVILHLFQRLFGISLTFRSGLVRSQPRAQSAFPITASGRSSKITAFSAQDVRAPLPVGLRQLHKSINPDIVYSFCNFYGNFSHRSINCSYSFCFKTASFSRSMSYSSPRMSSIALSRSRRVFRWLHASSSADYSLANVRAFCDVAKIAVKGQSFHGRPSFLPSQ